MFPCLFACLSVCSSAHAPSYAIILLCHYSHKHSESHEYSESHLKRACPIGQVLHIQMTPAEEHFNCDGELELPDCWMATLRRIEGGASSDQPLTSRHLLTNIVTCHDMCSYKIVGVLILTSLSP